MNTKSGRNPNVRCAIYARSATGNTAALESQVAVCRDYIANHNWTLSAGHAYKDGLASGNSSSRPGLQAILDAALAKPRPFDYLVVDDTSRLCRNLGVQGFSIPSPSRASSPTAPPAENLRWAGTSASSWKRRLRSRTQRTPQNLIPPPLCRLMRRGCVQPHPPEPGKFRILSGTENNQGIGCSEGINHHDQGVHHNEQ